VRHNSQSFVFLGNLFTCPSTVSQLGKVVPPTNQQTHLIFKTQNSNKHFFSFSKTFQFKTYCNSTTYISTWPADFPTFYAKRFKLWGGFGDHAVSRQSSINLLGQHINSYSRVIHSAISTNKINAFIYFFGRKFFHRKSLKNLAANFKHHNTKRTRKDEGAGGWRRALCACAKSTSPKSLW
jgi:hypothetical protein